MNLFYPDLIIFFYTKSITEKVIINKTIKVDRIQVTFGKGIPNAYINTKYNASGMSVAKVPSNFKLQQMENKSVIKTRIRSVL